MTGAEATRREAATVLGLGHNPSLGVPLELRVGGGPGPLVYLGRAASGVALRFAPTVSQEVRNAVEQVAHTALPSLTVVPVSVSVPVPVSVSGPVSVPEPEPVRDPVSDVISASGPVPHPISESVTVHVSCAVILER